MVTVEFRKASGTPGVVLNGVIPDSGADASVLPWKDCKQLELTPEIGRQGLMAGVADTSAATLVFRVWARIDGGDYLCRLQAGFFGGERILG